MTTLDNKTVRIYGVLLRGPADAEYLDSLLCSDLSAVEKRFDELEQASAQPMMHPSGRLVRTPPPSGLVALDVQRIERRRIIDVRADVKLKV